jgi:hypothetical protein
VIITAATTAAAAAAAFSGYQTSACYWFGCHGVGRQEQKGKFK